jgi:uncharacterized protein (DUF362 family)/Pyruvate/2-oxoacid:ferredoxin oxidoreductase delta subunit
MNARVAVLRCSQYEKEKVFETVHQALSLFGGIGAFVKPGWKVLLKPNMLSAREPDRGVTTHPFVLEALVREVQSAGCETWIGDSPSGALKGVKRCWENTGFKKVAEETGSKLINFEAGGTIQKEVNGNLYHLARAVFEADAVINIPKFKTHGLTLYTGSVKNLYGTLPGFQKARLHKRYPNPTQFSRVLAEIYGLVKPALTVMDGIVGMEGNGPATGQLRSTQLILASPDGIALDTVAAAAMGFKENEVDATRIAGESGYGESRLASIDILGETLESVRFRDFALPSNHLMKLVPAFLVRWLGRFVWVKPRADLKKCTGCGICVRSCPVNAIRLIEGRPVTDYEVCINCLCCNESCPENAVIQELSWLARRIG